jgi:hypothetical protein
MSILTAPLTYNSPPADILLAAADIAAAHAGDTRTLVADAIGAALDYCTPGDVDHYVIPAVVDPDQLPHPAFAVVMARLHGSIQDVFMWSCLHTAGQVAALMRDVAAAGQVAAA